MTYSNVPDPFQVYVTGHKIINCWQLNNKRRTEIPNQQHSFETLMQMFFIASNYQYTPRFDTASAAMSLSTVIHVQPSFENAAIETQNK